MQRKTRSSILPIIVTSKWLKLVGSFFLAVVIAAIVTRMLWISRDLLAWLSAALGLAAGWGTGILLAPYESEQRRFHDYLKFASVFVSGYLVGKLDRVFELWFDPTYGPLLLRSNFAVRIMVGLTSYLLAAISNVCQPQIP